MKKVTFSFILVIADLGLNMAGIRNMYVGIGLLMIAGVLFIWALIPAIKNVWKEVSGSLSKSKITLGFTLIILIILSFILTSITAYKVYHLEMPMEIESINKRTNELVRPENIKATIKLWLSTFGFTSIEAEDPTAHFLITTTSPYGKRLGITKTKQFPQYITIIAYITPSENSQKLLDKLSESKLQRISNELAIEIDRLHLEVYHFSLKEMILLIKMVPITNNFTEDTFIKALIEMESNEDLVVRKLQMELNKYHTALSAD